MKSLIGYSGFVGGTLLRQERFEHLFNSSNIAAINERQHDVVVCAAAPAQKWLANRDPEVDLKNIQVLIEHLGKLTCKKFILISTVDVFDSSVGTDEDTIVDVSHLHPYGLHRRQLERFVEDQFDDHLIVRLPGLVGPGLRKNVIFDFLNSNNLHAIDSRNVFQFYPMVNLWRDIQIALSSELKLVHLTAEPISVAEIVQECFGRQFDQVLEGKTVSYDFQTRHAEKFGGEGKYQYDKQKTLQAIQAYAQSEQPTLKQDPS